MKFLEDFNIKKYVKPKKKTSKPQGSSSITYTKPLPKGPIPVKKVVPDKIPTKPLPTTSSNKSSIVTKPFFNIPIQSPLPSPTAIKARHNEFVKANARANRAISDFKSNNVIANATSGIFKGVEFNKRVAPFIDTRPQAVRDFKVKNYAFRKNPIFKWYEKKVPNVGERRSGTGAFSNNGYVRNFTTGLFKVLSSDADPRGMLSDPTRRKIHEMQRANQAKALRAFTKGTGDLIADTIIRPFYQNAWQQAELKDRLKLRERKMNELYGLNRKQQTYYVEDDKGRVYAIKGSKNGGDTYSYIDSNGKALSLDITALPKDKVNTYKNIGLIPRDKVFRVKDGDQFLSQLLDPNYNSGLLARDSKGLPYISNKGLKQYLEKNGVRSNSTSLFEAISPKRRADDLMMQRYLVKSADDYVQNKYFGGYPQMSTRSIGANLAINFLGLGLNLINRPQQGVSAYIIGKKEGKTAAQIRKDMYAGFVEGKDTSFTEYYLTKKDKHPYLKGLLFDSISDPLLFVDFIAKGGAGVAKGITRASVKSEITERSLREVTSKYLGGARLLNKNEGLTFKESLHSVFETHKLGTVHQTRGVYSRTLGRLKGVQMTADALDNTLPKALLPNRTKRQLINTMVTNPKQVNKNWIANVLHEAGFRNNLKEDLADAIYDSYRTSRLVTNTARANKIADSTSGAYKVYKKFKAFGEEVDRVDTALTKAAFPVFTGTVKGTKKVVRAIKASELKAFVEKAKAFKQMPLSDVFKSEELLDLTKRRAAKQVDKAVEPLVKNHKLSMELINEESEKYVAAMRYGQHGKTDGLADLIAARDSRLIGTLDDIQHAVVMSEEGYNTAMKIIKESYEDATDITSVHEFLDNALQANDNFRKGLVYVTDDSERKTLSALIDARENQIFKTQRVLDNTEANRSFKKLSDFMNIIKEQVHTVDNYKALDQLLTSTIEQAHNATHYVDTALQDLVSKRIEQIRTLLKADATQEEFNVLLYKIKNDIRTTSFSINKLKKVTEHTMSISDFFNKFKKLKEELRTKSVTSTFYKSDTIESVLKDHATKPAVEIISNMQVAHADDVIKELKPYLPEYLQDAIEDIMDPNIDAVAERLEQRKLILRGEARSVAAQQPTASGISQIDALIEQDNKRISAGIQEAMFKRGIKKDATALEQSVADAFDTANKRYSSYAKGRLEFTAKKEQEQLIEELVAKTERVKTLESSVALRQSIGDTVSKVKQELTERLGSVDNSVRESLKNTAEYLNREHTVLNIADTKADITEPLLDFVADFINERAIKAYDFKELQLALSDFIDDTLDALGYDKHNISATAKTELVNNIAPQIADTIDNYSKAYLSISDISHYDFINAVTDSADNVLPKDTVASLRKSIEHSTEQIKANITEQLDRVAGEKVLDELVQNNKSLTRSLEFKDIRHNIVDKILDSARQYAHASEVPLTLDAQRNMVKEVLTGAINATELRGDILNKVLADNELIDTLLPYISDVINKYRVADKAIIDYTKQFADEVFSVVEKNTAAQRKVMEANIAEASRFRVDTKLGGKAVEPIKMEHFVNDITEFTNAFINKDWKTVCMLLNIKADSNMATFVRHLDVFLTESISDTITQLRLLDAAASAPLANRLANIEHTLVKARETAKFTDITLERDTTVRAIKANAAQVEATAQRMYKTQKGLFTTADYYMQRLDNFMQAGALDKIVESYRAVDDYKTATLLEQLAALKDEIANKKKANAAFLSSLEEAETVLSPELYNVYKDALFDARDLGHEAMRRPELLAPDFVDHVMEQHYYQYAKANYNLDKTIGDLYSFSKSKLSKTYEIDKDILDRLAVGHTAGVDTYRTVLTNIVQDPDGFRELVEKTKSGKDVFIFDTETLGLNTKRNTNHVFSMGLYKLDAARCDLLHYDELLERYTSESINKYMRALLEDADAGKGYKEILNKLPNSVIDNGVHPDTAFMDLAEFKKLYGYDGAPIENAGEIFAENIMHTMREMQGTDTINLHNIILCGFNNHGFDNVVMANNAPEIAMLFRDVPQNIDILSNIKAKHGLFISDKDRNIIGNLYNTLLSNVHDTGVPKFKHAYPSRLIDTYDRFYSGLQRLGHGATSLDSAVAHNKYVPTASALDTLFGSTPRHIDLNAAAEGVREQKFMLKSINHLKDDNLIVEHTFNLIPTNERSWEVGYLAMRLENNNLTRAEYEAMYKAGELEKYKHVISNWFYILDSNPEVDLLKLTPEEFIARADELREAADVMTGGQTSNVIRWINGVADGGYDYFQSFAVQNKVSQKMTEWFGENLNNYRAIETYRQLASNIQNNIRYNTDDIFALEKHAENTIIAWRELANYCAKDPELAHTWYIFKLQNFEALPLTERIAVLEELIMGKKFGLRTRLFGDGDIIARVNPLAYFEFTENTKDIINYIYDTRRHNGYNLFEKELEYFTRESKGAAYEIASELERVKHDTDAFEEFAERLSGITGGASVAKHTMAVALQPVNELKKQIVHILNETTSSTSVTDLYADLNKIRDVWEEVHHTRVKALVSDMLQNEDAILEHLITPDFNGMMFLRFSPDDDNIKLVDQLLSETHPSSKYLQVRYLDKEQAIAVTLNKNCDLDDEALHLLDTGRTIPRNNIVGKNMPTELLNTFSKRIDNLDRLAKDSVLRLYYESLQNLAAYSRHSFRDYTHGLLDVKKIDQLRAVFDPENMMDLDKFGMQTIDGFVSAGSYLTLAPLVPINDVKFYTNPLLTIETLLKRNAEQALDSHTTTAYFLRNGDLNSLNHFDLSDKEWFRVLDQLEDSFVVCAMGTDDKNAKYLSKLEQQIKTAKSTNNLKELERLGEEYRAYNPVQIKAFDIRTSVDLQRAKEAEAVLVPRVVYETLYGHVNNFTPTNPIARKWNRYVTMMKAFYISTLGTAMRNYIDETIKTYIDVGWEGVPIVHRARFQAMADLSDYNQIMAAIKKDLNTGQLIKKNINSPHALAHQRLVDKGIIDTPYYFNIPISDAQKYYGYLAEAGILPRHLTERMDASNFLRMHAFMLEGASGGTQAGEIQARALAHSIPELEGVAARNKGVFGTLGAFLKMPDKDLDSYVSMGNYLFSKGVSAALTPMAYTEQITRLTHMYTLEELGIGKIEAFSRISKTHFNYDVKDRAAVYAQLLFPFFNFTKLNIDYWMNVWTKDAHSIHNLLRLNQQNLKEALDDNYERTRNGQWVDMSYLNHAMAGNPRIPNPAQNEGQAAWLKLNPSFYDAYNFLLDPMNQGMQDIFSPIQNVLQDRHFFDGAIKAGIFNQGYGGNGLMDFLPLIGSTILPMHENKLRYIDKTFTEYRNDTFAQLLKSPGSFAQLPTILAFSKIDFGEDYEKFNRFLNANGYAYDFYTRQIKPIKDCVARDSKELSMYMYKKYGLVYDYITKTFVPAYLSKDPVTRNVSFKTPHSQAQWSDIQALAKLYQNKGYDFVSGSFVDLETKGAIFDRKQYEAWQRKRGYEKEYLTNTWVPLGTARAHSYGEAAEYMRTKGMEWDYILKKYVPSGTALAHNYKEANRLYGRYGFEYDYARNAYVPKGRATVNNFNEYKRFQRERNGLEWDYATRQWVPLGTAKASSWKDLYGDDWHRRRHFHKHWKRRKGHKFKRFDTWEEVVEFQRGRGLAWDSITRKWVKLGTEATWDDLVEYKKSKGLGWDRINKQWVELDKVPTWDQYQKYKESQGLEWDYIQKTWVPKGSAIGKKWKDFQNYKKSTGKTYDYIQQRYVGGKKMKTPKAQFNYDYHMKYHVGKIKPKRNYLDSMIHKYINNQDPNVRYNITTMPSLNMYQVKSLRTKRPVPRMRLQEVQRMQTSFVKYYKKSQSI